MCMITIGWLLFDCRIGRIQIQPPLIEARGHGERVDADGRVLTVVRGGGGDVRQLDSAFRV